MAWTLTARGTTKGTYAAAANVGNTFTPAQNDIIVVFNLQNDSTAHTDVTGWSATDRAQILSPTQLGATSVWMSAWALRIGASPGSGQANIDFGGASTNYSAGVLQISGAHTTATIGVGGSNLFRQVVALADYDQPSPFAITALSAFASSTNLALTLGGISTNLPIAPKSGFTEVIESSGATYNPNVWAAYKTSEDTAHQLLEQSAGDFDFKYIIGVAIEVLEASTGGTVNTKTITDTASFSDSTVQMPVRGRITTDTLALSDLIRLSAYHNRTLTDTATLNDFSALREFVMIFSDTLDLTDSQVRMAVRSRVVSEALAMSDLVQISALHTRQLSDAITALDTLTSYAIHRRLITEALDLNDLVTALRIGTSGTTYSKVISDAIELADTLSKSMLASRQTTDTLSLTDLARFSALHSRQVTDTATLIDDQIMRRWWTRVLTDTATLLDTIIGTNTGAVFYYSVYAQVGIDRSSMPTLGADFLSMPTLGGAAVA